jgi:multimeric flavodoxin WrbA
VKVTAFNGSPKQNGNTFRAISLVCEELEASGIQTEIVHIGSEKIRGCVGCGSCAKNKDERCAFSDDPVNDCIQKIKASNGILLGSPVYYSGIAGTMKSFLDRLFYVAGSNGSMFRHKTGAAIAAVRRSGGVTTVDQLNHYLLNTEMIIATSSYWNVIHGAVPGEVDQDGEGVQIMRTLGRNMAWIMKLVERGSGEILPPPQEKKVRTNFIR